jgi:hypothetical protein
VLAAMTPAIVTAAAIAKREADPKAIVDEMFERVKLDDFEARCPTLLLESITGATHGT